MRVGVVWMIVMAGCGFRISTNVDPDAVIDDASGDSRPHLEPGPCGKPGALADDFGDGVVATWWDTLSPSAVVEQNHTLRITPTGSAPAGYRSRSTVDLRDGAAEIEVRGIATGVGVANTFEAIGVGGSVGFDVSNGQLIGRIGAASMLLPFDSSLHRHLRIADTGGVTRLSTSPDGATWAELVAAPSPAWIGASTISITATSSLAANGGSAVFAEMSTFVAPAAWCPVSSLVDSFNGDGTIGIEWGQHAHTNANCIEYEASTSAHADQSPGGPCDAYYASSSLFALKDSEMFARITAITNYQPGWITYLSVRDLDDRFVRLAFDNGEMCADGTGIPRTCKPYTQSHDYWRVRESDGTLHFETGSGPNPTWFSVLQVATPFDVSAIRPSVGTSTDRSITNTISLSVDRFN